MFNFFENIKLYVQKLKVLMKYTLKHTFAPDFWSG